MVGTSVVPELELGFLGRGGNEFTFFGGVANCGGRVGAG